jgi:hypothetical protein
MNTIFRSMAAAALREFDKYLDETSRREVRPPATGLTVYRPPQETPVFYEPPVCMQPEPPKRRRKVVTVTEEVVIRRY